MKRETPFSSAGIALRRSRVAPFLAFSLVEIMVVVSLLSVIILGLMAMFNQTQRAFKLGMAQTDVLENGRMATDLMMREFEQITPSYQDGTVNFLVELAPPVRLSLIPAVVSQRLPASTEFRTNALQEFFFVTRENRSWKGIGYLVYPPRDGAGTLYRFECPNYATNSPEGLAGIFDADISDLYHNGTLSQRFSKIADGVVSLRVRAYDPRGVWLNPGMFSPVTKNTNAVFSWDPVVGESQYYFYSNAVPASVELELGILEQQSYNHFKTIAVPDVQADYLTNQAHRVHLFRQRISIRNVDPSAYEP